jgi:PAS domain S-box-containing protein
MNRINDSKILSADIPLEFQSYIELPDNNPLVIVDLGLKIVYCNEAFKNTFELDVENDISSIPSNPEFVYLIKGFNESKYKNIAVDVNLSLQNNSVIKSYTVRIERVYIRSNQYYVLSIESLDQRKRLENKITSLHNALDQGKLPLMILDDRRKIIYASKSFEVVLSLEIENMYAVDILEILKDFLDVTDLSEMEYALRNALPWKKLIPVIRKHPVEYWEFYLNPVAQVDQVNPNFILIASNLTDHINQTRAIERSEKKQKSIINNISDLLLIVEYIGVAALFENANDNFCKIFGLDKNKIHSLKIEDFIPVPLAEEIYNSIYKLNTHSFSIGDFTYTHIDKCVYNCKITSIPERERNSTYFVITMKDITEEVLYREQLKKAYHKEMQLNKMKSDFLANMSHEIRTPFNAVVGFSEIIDESIETGDNETLRELIGSMKEVLGRALNLFTNIIELSQIESGEIEMEEVDLNCNHVIRNVYYRTHQEAEKKGIEFILELTESDCVTEVDWVKFEKIIYSLIDNAIKYTSHGYVYVGTKLSNHTVEIVISDTGVGIENSQIDRILKPFNQEIEGYTRPFEGAGLGLTIAYKLTLLMGGQFYIVSEKNKGTKVTLCFPETT